MNTQTDPKTYTDLSKYEVQGKERSTLQNILLATFLFIVITILALVSLLVPILINTKLASVKNKKLQKSIPYNLTFYDGDHISGKLTEPGLLAEDEIKQEIIISVLNELRVSSEIVDRYAVIFIDPTTRRKSPFFYINHNGVKEVVQPAFLNPSKGMNAAYTSFAPQQILINSKVSPDDGLKAVLLHELGHIVKLKLSAEEFKSFMELRNMPEDVVIASYTNDYSFKTRHIWETWDKNPLEDFAEVFKKVYGRQENEYYWEIHTTYGDITERQKAWMLEVVSPKFQQ